MKRTIIRKLTTLVLLFAIVTTCIGIQSPAQAKAAEQYITRFNFLKLVMKEIGVEVEGTGQDAYIQIAKEIGLLNEGTFETYDNFISKIDAAVIIVRAHEFLYGVTVSEDLSKEVQAKRISDISKVTKAKRVYLAKAYALGYIVGKSNGVFSTDRTFNPNYRIKISYAKQIISLLNNPKDRSVVAPDGQLTRATNLPEFAKYYPYILASFPNKYYDWEFAYMRMVYSDGTFAYGTKEYMDKYYDRFVSPADFESYKNGKPVLRKSFYSSEKCTAEELYELYAKEWEENAREYLKLVFNVNYKTIDKTYENWKEAVLLTTDQASIENSANSTRLDTYLEKMKNNKTIIECGKVAVDKSTLYVSDGWYYIRAYVKYRIISSNITKERVGTSPLAYTYFDFPYYTNIKIGQWKESYFDIQVMQGPKTNGVYSAMIHDWYYENRLVMK